MRQCVPVYLPAGALQMVQKGRFPFFRRVGEALATQGWTLEPRKNNTLARVRARLHRGPTLFFMDDPTHAGALVCRRTYVEPFWHIEPSAQRWEWPVAKADFVPGDPNRARQFANYWRKRLYDNRTTQSRRDGFVFVPLQGLLRKQRSFQSMSPLAMLETLLQRETRLVLATLHPRETYTDAERADLEALRMRYSRLRVEIGGAEQALLGCDVVVTMNSAVAFQGYFFRKPALLFGKIDFHHIAASVPRDGLEHAFATAETGTPDYDGYLHWFLKQHAINISHEDCLERILQALRRGGWSI